MQSYLTRYQSANLSDTESRDCFVVRQREFQEVMNSIRTTGPKDSIQHYVFIGRRGSGKSTLLRRIQAEVSLSDLNEKFIVVNPSEEQAGVYQLYDLWDYVLRDFDQQGLDPKTVDWETYQDDMQAYTQALFAKVVSCLEKADKQLILLIDNIDRIFKNIRKGEGGGADMLREQLMNRNLVRIVGASTLMSEDYWRYDMPFYDFFQIQRLEALSIEEIGELLSHWGAQKEGEDIKQLIQKQPGKLQAIRMLTDGTPRTMLLFVDMLIHRPEQNGYDYLRKIIDDATPIYQERLDQLSPQQQKVLVELSFFWEAAPVEKLIPACKMPGKTISAQLGVLVKARIVEKVKGETKNLSYRLEERFFNLWLLMTQGGPRQKREVKYLTVFLENWYDSHEIKTLYKEHEEGIESGKYKPDYTVSMAKALAHSRKINAEDRDELIDKVRSIQLPSQLMAEPLDKTREIYKKSGSLLRTEDYQKAEEDVHSAKERLAFLYYQENRTDKKVESVELIKDLTAEELKNFGLFGKSTIYLWAGEMELFSNLLDEEIPRFTNGLPEDSLDILQQWLIHKQTHTVLELFEREGLKNIMQEQLRPLYYATLGLLNKKEQLKNMPPELKENVNDILDYVKKRQAFYYGK